MIDHTTGAETIEISDGVAGYLRDNPNCSDRFFDQMAKKAAMETPNQTPLVIVNQPGRPRQTS